MIFPIEPMSLSMRLSTLIFIVTTIFVVTLIAVKILRRDHRSTRGNSNIPKNMYKNAETKQDLALIEHSIDEREREIECRYRELNEMKKNRTILLDKVNQGKKIILDRLLRLNDERKNIEKMLTTLAIDLSRIDVDAKMLSETKKLRNTSEHHHRAKRYIEDDTEREKYFESLWTNVKPRSIPYCNVNLPQ